MSVFTSYTVFLQADVVKESMDYEGKISSHFSKTIHSTYAIYQRTFWKSSIETSSPELQMQAASAPSVKSEAQALVPRGTPNVAENFVFNSSRFSEEAAIPTNMSMRFLV